MLPMVTLTYLFDTWLHAVDHPVRLFALVVLSLAVAAFTFAWSKADTKDRGLQTLNGLAAGATTALVVPFSIHTVYLSAGPWVWALAATGVVGLMGGAMMRAIRAASGVVTWHKGEVLLWLLGFAHLWVAGVLVDAWVWAAVSAVTFLAAYLVLMFIPGLVSGVVEPVMRWFPAMFLSLTVIATGVPWVGLSLLGVGVITAGFAVRMDDVGKTVASQWCTMVMLSGAAVSVPVLNILGVPHVGLSF